MCRPILGLPLFSAILAGILSLVPSGLTLAQPLRNNPSEPGYLGLVADDRREAGRGVRVMEVVAGGPADKGGLQAGDLVTAINERAIREMGDFAAVLEATPPGAKLAFRVSRAGREQDFAVTLAARPKADERRFPDFGRIPGNGATGRPLLGVQSSPVSDAARRRWNFPPGESGALVDSVAANTPAEAAGFQVGDLILAINGRRIRDPEDLAQRVQAAGVGGKIEVTYWSAGRILRQELVLADSSALAGPSNSEPPVMPKISTYPPPPNGPPQPANETATGVTAAKPTTEPPLILKKSADDKGRIEMLEDRVRELEARIRDLEKILKQREP